MNSFQRLFYKGVFNSHFERPLLNMLIKENSNKVREEAFSLLIELKRAVGLLAATKESLVEEVKEAHVDEIISKLPKKFQIKQVMEKLNLTEKNIDGKQRYISQVTSYDDRPIKPNIAIVEEEKQSEIPKLKPKVVKKKAKKMYKIDPERKEQLLQQLGDEELNELKQALAMIQNISDGNKLIAQDVENLLTDLEITKTYVIECIQFTLLNNISENVLENQELMIPENLTLLVQKILSLSRETKDGEMIHNLILILLILSAYITEPKALSLATSIFTSCSAKKGD